MAAVPTFTGKTLEARCEQPFVYFKLSEQPSVSRIAAGQRVFTRLTISVLDKNSFHIKSSGRNLFFNHFYVAYGFRLY